jgi:signal transduction histidine kinase
VTSPFAIQGAPLRFDLSDAWATGHDDAAGLGLVIPLRLVQSRLLGALCIAAAIALVALLHRWRVRQLDRRRQRLLDESLAERERIARQLHDTLLQGT